MRRLFPVSARLPNAVSHSCHKDVSHACELAPYRRDRSRPGGIPCVDQSYPVARGGSGRDRSRCHRGNCADVGLGGRADARLAGRRRSSTPRTSRPCSPCAASRSGCATRLVCHAARRRSPVRRLRNRLPPRRYSPGRSVRSPCRAATTRRTAATSSTFPHGVAESPDGFSYYAVLRDERDGRDHHRARRRRRRAAGEPAAARSGASVQLGRARVRHGARAGRAGRRRRAGERRLQRGRARRIARARLHGPVVVRRRSRTAPSTSSTR